MRRWLGLACWVAFSIFGLGGIAQGQSLTCVPANTSPNHSDFDVNPFDTTLSGFSVDSTMNSGNYLGKVTSAVAADDASLYEPNIFYIGNSELQPMVELAQQLSANPPAGLQIRLCFGKATIMNRTRPVIFGIRITWAPSDFSQVNNGLVRMLEAKLATITGGCRTVVKTEIATSNAPATIIGTTTSTDMIRGTLLALVQGMRKSVTNVGLADLYVTANIIRRIQVE